MPKVRLQVNQLRRFVTIRTFVRVLAWIYLIAFCSLGVQALGLIGSRGILPFGDFLDAVKQAFGRSAYWREPTLLWLSRSDAALQAVWIAGAIAALIAAFGVWQRAALAVCLVLWLSLCVVGQEFLSFQWDVLLLEAGFLALFADTAPARVWLFRWLAFRLMFFSGVVKLTSHDAAWRNLTALTYHYETQPLPTPLAWYMTQLPLWFQKFSTAMVFVAELGAPFLFFGPKRLRHIGAWITIAFQVLILLTGNYTFFNILTIALMMFLFIEPERSPRSRTHRAVSIALVAFIGVTTGLLFLELFSVDLPPGGGEILRVVEPFRIVNTYGLFAVMTTERIEIVVEGSSDGDTWRAYEFRYKPGDLKRAPPIVAPHQPRLDWQMWFAALGNYRQNRWFVNLMIRLLQGEPSVLRLLESNPFPGAPPKYIRARAYLYHFTDFAERRRDGAWWRREDHGMYFPAVSLK
jgi:lipase maturation factor 1